LHTSPTPPPTYVQLSPEDADRGINKTSDLIESFILDKADALSLANQTYLSRSLKVKDKFGHFYIMAKVHKSPWAVRPIVSVSGSIT
jgi:hypothetical protein